MEQKVFTIGRNPDNAIVINDPEKKVSRYHCRLLPLSENTYLLEDLDSTGGTFVDGIQVKRAVVSVETPISLAKMPLLLDQIPALKKNEIQTPPKTDNDYREEFAKLKEVYEGIKQAKLSLQKKEAFKTSMVRGALAFIPIVGPSLAMIVGSNVTSIPEKMMALNEELKINYVCPKCKSFLGELPWEALANKKVCDRPNCKAIWV